MDLDRDGRRDILSGSYSRMTNDMAGLFQVLYGKADGMPVHVEEPGWACPCWADMDGDGKKDLLVGQFNGGKIRVYRNLGDGKLAAGDWLKADGTVAEIPGVW